MQYKYNTMEEFLNQLNKVDRKKLENLIKLDEEGKDLPILEEIQQTNTLLEQILNKSDIEIPEFPTIPVPVINVEPPVVNVQAPVVEVKTEKVDLTKTNSLLEKILNKENTNEDINITLELV